MFRVRKVRQRLPLTARPGITLKMALLAPMLNARVSVITTVKPGLDASSPHGVAHVLHHRLETEPHHFMASFSFSRVALPKLRRIAA